ncbi:MAG: YARHG domain-containing protein [Lachnospiraceae bacterium]|nr:YARHG domain-containing protein [Lachnospiraceae bacterium]
MSTKTLCIMVMALLIVFTTSCEGSPGQSVHSDSYSSDANTDFGSADSSGAYVADQDNDADDPAQNAEDGQASVSASDSAPSSDLPASEEGPSEETSNVIDGRPGPEAQDTSIDTDINTVFEEKRREIEDEYGRIADVDLVDYFDAEDFYSQNLAVEDAAFEEGVLFTDLFDYDSDGAPELLIVRRENGRVEESQGDRVIGTDRSDYILEIYEANRDGFFLADSIIVGVFDLMQWSVNYANLSFFRHEVGENAELCVESYICQQDHPDDTSLISFRYRDGKISLTDGIRFGYWFGENSVLCEEPQSEKAIEYLSDFFPSSQNGWETIARANDFDDHFKRIREDKCKAMGFDLLKTRLDVENTFPKSEMDGDDYNEMHAALANLCAADCYSPIDGSLTMMAFLKEYREDSGEQDGRIGIVHSVKTYLDQEESDPDLSASEPDEPAEEVAVSEEDYILPDSDRRLLTEDDLAGLDEERLMLARNEIYARHGRMFKDETIKSWFDARSWYKGTIPPEEFSEDTLSEIEQKNAEMILAYEKGLKTDTISEYFTNEQLENMKRALGIPEDLPVEVHVGNPYYWEGGGKDLVQVDFYTEREYVAGAAFEPYKEDPVRNIYQYMGD